MTFKTKQHEHKRYIIFSGYIISKKDKDRHLITTRELVSLYDLNRYECIEIPIDYKGPMPSGDFITLRPRVKGDYKEYLESISVGQND